LGTKGTLFDLSKQIANCFSLLFAPEDEKQSGIVFNQMSIEG
jgi:hypothetical protein